MRFLFEYGDWSIRYGDLDGDGDGVDLDLINPFHLRMNLKALEDVMLDACRRTADGDPPADAVSAVLHEIELS